MGYEVRFVESGSLPSGIDWAFARTTEGEAYLFISKDAIDPESGRCGALQRAWTACELAEGGQGLAMVV